MTVVTKKTFILLALVLGAITAFTMLAPAAASAQQVPVDANDILCYTQEEANQMLMDGFELQFPVCEEEEEEPVTCNEGEVLEDDVCVPEEDEGEGEEDGGEVTPPADTNSSGGGGGGGGGSRRSSGSVLGASDEICSTPLLTSYLGMGKTNDLVETIKLQLFLSTELGLTNLVTGTFDGSTQAAVEQFQIKYAEEVLAPWVPFGLQSTSTPTGYVYKTTQRMINKIHCASLEIPMPQLP